jgi:hypothetical protein
VNSELSVHFVHFVHLTKASEQTMKRALVSGILIASMAVVGGVFDVGAATKKQAAATTKTAAPTQRPDREGGHAAPAVAAKEPTLAQVAESVPVPKGCQAKGKPEYFDREGLYKAIDGMAPEYQSYGCVGMATLEWPSAKDPNEKIEAEISDLGSPLGAFGIYSRAHAGEGKYEDWGEEVAVDEDAMDFARGRYYVRLMGPEANARPILEPLARAILKRIPAGPRPAEFVKALPEKGRLPRTERWIPEAGFGMEFMRNVVAAKYKSAGTTAAIELHVATFPDAAAAGAAFGKFRETVKEQKPAPIQGNPPGFEYKDEWIGRVGVFHQDRHLIVLVGYEPNGVAKGLLEATRARQTRSNAEARP